MLTLQAPARRPGKHPRSDKHIELPCPPRPIKRIPLQELPISPSGSLLPFRERSIRPAPTADIENLSAMARALEYRHATLTQNINQLLARFQQLHDRLHAALREYALASHANQPSATHVTTHPRLSMPLLDSDESDSEPDLSVLGMARPGPALDRRMNMAPYDTEVVAQEHYEVEDTSVEEEEEEEEEAEEDFEEEDVAVPLIDPATVGLKEISNLGKFTVSSSKQGNGVEELRSDDLKLYWQSDGPQPHKLTVYFVKRVGIRDIRFFVDYNEDESYTPTKIIFKSGTSENNLIEFAVMNLVNPVGWQQVPVAGAGGDPDGNTLVSYVLQMQILENHQNGKDTHLRGIKIYAFDAESAQGAGRENNPVDDVVGLVEEAVDRTKKGTGDRLSSVGRSSVRFEPGDGGLTIPDFMRDPEIR